LIDQLAINGFLEPFFNSKRAIGGRPSSSKAYYFDLFNQPF